MQQKASSLSGASPPDSLARGSSPGPRWGHSTAPRLPTSSPNAGYFPPGSPGLTHQFIHLLFKNQRQKDPRATDTVTQQRNELQQCAGVGQFCTGTNSFSTN